MADSFEFLPEHKTNRFGQTRTRNPLNEIPEFIGLVPEVFGSMDTPDAYDIAFGDTWINGLNEAQAIMVLKVVRSRYMRELNKMQKEIDRLSILDLPSDDPRVHTPWPRYYELKVKKEKR